MIQLEVLDPVLSKTSVIALNGVLYEIQASIIESPLLSDLVALSLQAARSTDVSPSLSNHAEIRTTSLKPESSHSVRSQQTL